MMELPSFGKYQVVRLLGRGGMASVYEAVDPLLDRHVAIKVIHPHLAEEKNFGIRFSQEARLVASLRHPHIIRLHDFDILNGQPFMVMEFLDGGSLKDRLDSLRQKGLAYQLGAANQILQALASALHYAHEQGAVHRDIKPANVLFTRQNEPVVTDFGIAKILHESVQISLTGGVIGTPVYMSPEQAAGLPVDGQSDQYSLAVMMYEMMVGRAPFLGDSATAILMSHINETPPPPRKFNQNLPAAAEKVLLRALSKKPAARYANVLDFAHAMDAALHGASPQPATTGSLANTIQNTHVEQNRVSTVAPQAVPGRPAGAQTAAPLTAQTDRSTLSPSGKPLGETLSATTPGPEPTRSPALSQALAGGSTGRQVTQSAGLPWKKLLLPGLGLFVLLGLVALAAAFFAFGGLRLFTPPTSPATAGYKIAIADFDGAQASLKVDFSRRIYEEMQGEAASLQGQLSFVQTRQVYPDAETARKEGQKLGVDMLIWGWYDDLGVSPHIEMISKPVSQTLSLQHNQFFSIARSQYLGDQDPVNDLDLSSFYSYLRVPRLLTDFNLFAANGPQQLAYISEAIIGLAFQARGDYPSALALFDKALANASALPAGGKPTSGTPSPGLDLVRFQRGMILAQLERYSEAAQDLQLAAELNPGLYEAYYNLAILYPDICTPARQLEAARTAAEKAVQLQPEQPSAHRLLAGLYLQLSQYENALNEARAAEKLDDQDPLTYLLMREIYKAQGLTDQAQQAAEKGFELRQAQQSTGKQSDLQTWISLGDAALQANKLDEARQAYTRAAGLAKDSPDVHRALGNLSFRSGDFSQAAQEFEAWTKLEPKNPWSFNSLGLALLRQRNFEPALAALNTAAGLTSCSASTSLLLGNVYWEQMDYPHAEEAFSQTVKVDPSSAYAYYFLGATLHLQDKNQQAAAALDRALQLDPNLIEAVYARGTTAYFSGEYEQALGYFQKVIAAVPGDFQAVVDLGNSYDKLKDYPKAIEAYQKALSIKEDPDVRTYLGMEYARMQNYTQAVVELRKAVQASPKSSLALNSLGDALLQTGDLDGAAQVYLQALDVDDEPLTRAQLALIFNRQGRLGLAVEQLEKALVKGDQIIIIHSQLAGLYSRLGRLEDARKQYQAMLNLDPQRAEAHSGLGALAYKTCDLAAMSSEYTQAATLGSSYSFYYALPASAYAAQGFPQQQAQVVSDTLKTFPDDPVARIIGAEYHMNNGSGIAAQGELQSALKLPGILPVFQAIVHYDLSLLQLRLGNLTAAQAELNLSLQVYPLYAPSQALLGDVKLRQGKADEGLQAYDLALKLLPEYGAQVGGDSAELMSPALKARRALALEQLKRSADANQARQEALRQANDLVQQTPDWPQARFVLATIEYSLKNSAQADGDFAAAIRCDASMAAQALRVKADLDSLAITKPSK